jgi:hypothetical protein
VGGDVSHSLVVLFYWGFGVCLGMGLDSKGQVLEITEKTRAN